MTEAKLEVQAATADATFDPQTVASDLLEVRRIYSDFFATLTDADWERPVKGKHDEWTLHETVAHLCALNGDGLQSIQARLRDEPYIFEGLDDRYQFNNYNRQGINDHLGLSRQALCNKLLDILDQSAKTAAELSSEQAELAAEMPIYNRPLTLVEALSIIMFHTGLNHAAQVAEPAGVAPLWQHLTPEVRHRAIGRVVRALSLLYRHDLGGDLRSVLAFHVDGEGGGKWHVDISPEAVTSAEGDVSDPSLRIRFRDTALLCEMFTGRLNLPLAFVTGRLRLHGNLRLFLRFSSLFSVDARS
jgi:hypothetical protein